MTTNSHIVDQACSDLSVYFLPTGSMNFLLKYVNALVKAMERLNIEVTYKNIIRYGINIEKLLGPYMKYLITKDVAIVLPSLSIKHSFHSMQAGENNIFGKNPRLHSRDRKVLALWRYCNERDLFDSVSSVLSNTFETKIANYAHLLLAFSTLGSNQRAV